MNGNFGIIDLYALTSYLQMTWVTYANLCYSHNKPAYSGGQMYLFFHFQRVPCWMFLYQAQNEALYKMHPQTAKCTNLYYLQNKPAYSGGQMYEFFHFCRIPGWIFQYQAQNEALKCIQT